MKVLKNLDLSADDLVVVNGLVVNAKMVEAINCLLRQDRPVTLLRIISNKVTEGLIKSGGDVNDEPFVIIQGFISDLIEAYDSVLTYSMAINN